MKILLVRPSEKGYSASRLPEKLNDIQGVYLPLGLMYISSILEKNGHHVKIIDGQLSNLENLKAELIGYCPDIVGISSMTPNFNESIKIARMAKSEGIITVLGGPHISIYPKEIISYDCVDYGLLGESEYSFLNLVENIEQKKDIKNIPGLLYKKGKKKILNKPNLIKNLDELPFPSRHLLSEGKYNCILNKDKYTTMITSRGCPYTCSFCFKKTFDNIFRKRTAENVVDEIELCVQKYCVKELMFYDEAFSFDAKHVSSICNEIISRKIDIKWEATFRVDHSNLSMLKLMKKAGCIRLRYGVESGNEKTLSSIQKGISLKSIKKVFKTTKLVGIETLAYFMLGFPGENKKEINQTINFAKDLKPDWALFLAVTPLPSTPLFDECVSKGLIRRDYWKTLNRPKNEFLAQCQKKAQEAYKSFYLRPTFIFSKVNSVLSRERLLNYYKGFRNIVSFKHQGVR